MKCAKTQNMPSREGERIVDLLTIQSDEGPRVGPKWWPGIFAKSEFLKRFVPPKLALISKKQLSTFFQGRLFPRNYF